MLSLVVIKVLKTDTEVLAAITEGAPGAALHHSPQAAKLQSWCLWFHGEHTEQPRKGTTETRVIYQRHKWWGKDG